MLCSLNSYYSQSDLGKRKYLSLRKSNQQATFQISKITNFASYELLPKETENIDIGQVHDTSELCFDTKNIRTLF